MTNHLNISVYGRVQGIFFRRTVRHEAGRQGISGFVRNEPDGSVYIEAEAEEENLKKFLEWLKSGAGEGEHKITLVDAVPGPVKLFDRFEIKE